MRSRRSGKLIPATLAAYGNKLVAVMPGNELASRHQNSPAVSRRKSTRPYTPSFTYDWFGRVDYLHRGKEFTDYTNLNYLQSSDIVNLRLGLRTDKFVLEAFVKNVTNNETPSGAVFQEDPLSDIRFPPVAASSDIRLALPDKRTGGIHAKYSF